MVIKFIKANRGIKCAKLRSAVVARGEIVCINNGTIIANVTSEHAKSASCSVGAWHGVRPSPHREARMAVIEVMGRRSSKRIVA